MPMTPVITPDIDTKSRPILFSAQMIRALLEGRKTQTRRIMKPAPPSVEAVHAKAGIDFSIFDDGRCHDKNGQPLWRVAGPVWAVRDLLGGKAPDSVHWRCPFGAPGDRLWVRETWGLHDTQPSDGPEHATVYYRATDGNLRDLRHQLWRPSIYMPRWASRITLEVTGVRVARLHDITDEDAACEGASWGGEDKIAQSACEAFRCLWDVINPDSWKANPWVWALSFKRVGA